MDYCIANYCFTGYEIAILIVLEILFWTGLGFFGYRKYKKAKIKNKKKWKI
tara:strand:+ start:315 stop:467 length:153 start_codon:yes stop_codon:yes gene_type:complete